MTTIRINTEKALEMIHGAVVERGEGWQYPDTGQCRYVYHPEDFDRWADDEDGLTAEEEAMVAYFGDEKKPACLIGLALTTLNEEFLPWLDQNNENSVDGIMGTREAGFSVVIAGTTYEFTDNARSVLQVAQSAQDRGLTWGEAERLAVKRAER
jgi:hypothetical protein